MAAALFPLVANSLPDVSVVPNIAIIETGLGNKLAQVDCSGLGWGTWQ